MDIAVLIAERIRSGFEAAGAAVAGHAVGGTVSVGLATAHEVVTNIDALIARADAALYRAKNDGRNRLRTASDEPAGERARLIAAARTGRTAAVMRVVQNDSAA